MVPLNERNKVRGGRDRWRGVAYTMIGLPFLALALVPLMGREFDPQYLLGIPIGGAILLWQRLRPTGVPKHLAAVDRHDDGTYVAWCDCLWQGEAHSSEDAARIEARTHTENVREGLHMWGD